MEHWKQSLKMTINTSAKLTEVSVLYEFPGTVAQVRSFCVLTHPVWNRHPLTLMHTRLYLESNIFLLLVNNINREYFVQIAFENIPNVRRADEFLTFGLDLVQISLSLYYLLITTQTRLYWLRVGLNLGVVLHNMVS